MNIYKPHILLSETSYQYVRHVNYLKHKQFNFDCFRITFVCIMFLFTFLRINGKFVFLSAFYFTKQVLSLNAYYFLICYWMKKAACLTLWL